MKQNVNQNKSFVRLENNTHESFSKDFFSG